MGTTTQHGYLLLADLSGYTSFVAGTELDHSHEILSDLLETICMRIEKLLTIHKLEGDAVFAYAPEAVITRGETVLELIESTYMAFRDRQTDIRRATTCTCKACQNIPSLDLKFILHHGDYILQQVRGIREMVGSDVNLVHRLSKNHVTDPPLTWEWMQDPHRRNLWSGGHVHWYGGDRPKGRAGSRASNHCAHGKTVSTEVTVDWRPFEYSTVESYEKGKKIFRETIRFDPLPNGGTRVHDYAVVELPLPRWVRRIVAYVVLLKQMKYDQLIGEAARLAGEEYRKSLNPE